MAPGVEIEQPEAAGASTETSLLAFAQLLAEMALAIVPPEGAADAA